MSKAKKTLIILGIILGICALPFIISFFAMGRVINKEIEESERTHYDRVGYYDESDERTYGYAGEGQSIDFESFYGIKLSVNGNNIVCTPYSNIGGINIENISVNILAVNWVQKELASFPCNSLDTAVTFNATDILDDSNIKEFFRTGVYTVTADFVNSSNGAKTTVTGYLHDADDGFKCCRVQDIDQESLDEKEAELNAIFADLNPDDWLDESALCYPITKYKSKDLITGEIEIHALYNMTYSCVNEFQELSDEIVDDNWNDAVKTYAFTRYIVDHYAYDTYQVEKLHNERRACKANDVDNPKYWSYESHIGMCQDFTNILVIMCRHHGIPCTSMLHTGHVIPVAYISNEWVPIDVNSMLPECTQKDMNPALWECPEYVHWEDCFGTVWASKMNKIGRDIDGEDIQL